MKFAKLTILATCFVALFVGCKRLFGPSGAPDASGGDEVTAAQNWLALAAYAWPFAAPLVRFIPVVGPILQPIIANISWASLATKEQKDADK